MIVVLNTAVACFYFLYVHVITATFCCDAPLTAPLKIHCIAITNMNSSKLKKFLSSKIPSSHKSSNYIFIIVLNSALTCFSFLHVHVLAVLVLSRSHTTFCCDALYPRCPSQNIPSKGHSSNANHKTVVLLLKGF